jgi:hypothetical protein
MNRSMIEEIIEDIKKKLMIKHVRGYFRKGIINPKSALNLIFNPLVRFCQRILTYALID